VKVDAAKILPSQDYLKEDTVKFIFDCLHDGKIDSLPPKPFVRKNPDGKLVAIDGHNLIAVCRYRKKPVDVIMVGSASDSLPPISAANRARNVELAKKFDSAVTMQQNVALRGIKSFDDLIAKYPGLFDSI
jgi:hypothetical protein